MDAAGTDYLHGLLEEAVAVLVAVGRRHVGAALVLVAGGRCGGAELGRARIERSARG